MAQDQFVNKYSGADRLLHRLAFASPGLQVSLADIEDRLHGKALAQIGIERPVFITALPRAGTTIALNFLFETGEFASHTYRNMPFVLCPVLWQQISGSFRSRNGASMERAHGDGLAVSVDSVEAFEEILWRHFWPKHYASDRIKPWNATNHLEFVEFFQNHMRKLIWLRDQAGTRRYLSKNNLNISRIDYIAAIFEDARIVVPFRDPLQHAASLLKQHQQFLRSHKEDSFARDYMRGVGHYDFGANLLPVDFDHWLSGDRRHDAVTLSFWLEYWIAAYRHVLGKVGDSVQLMSFERMTRHPRSCLQWLSEFVQLDRGEALVRQHTGLRQPREHPVDDRAAPRALVERAQELHQQLLAASAGGDWDE